MKSVNWNLNIYITHYLATDLKVSEKNVRIRQLADLILNIAQVKVKSISVKVFTNVSESDHLAYISIPLKSMNTPACLEVVTVPTSEMISNGVYNPWLLTWSHKKNLKTDVENSSENTLFLYLEDDLLFNQSNLEYFLDTRDSLREFNLIPGYVRAEWSSIHNCWINSDRLPGNIQKDYLLKDSTGKSFKIRQFENPYFAAFLMDKDLALDYVSSDSFNVDKATQKHPIIWDTGATAALGLICEDVPEGFWYRTAVLLSEPSEYPTIGSVLRHQGDRYANDLWFRQRSLFCGQSESELPLADRNFRDYVKKLIDMGPRVAIQTIIEKVR